MKLENAYRLHCRKLELEHPRWFRRRSRARQRNSTCVFTEVEAIQEFDCFTNRLPEIK